METIFDYAPTEWELNALRFDSFSFMLKFGIELKEELTPESYKKHITKEFATTTKSLQRIWLRV